MILFPNNKSWQSLFKREYRTFWRKFLSFIQEILQKRSNLVSNKFFFLFKKCCKCYMLRSSYYFIAKFLLNVLRMVISLMNQTRSLVLNLEDSVIHFDRLQPLVYGLDWKTFPEQTPNETSLIWVWIRYSKKRPYKIL